MPRIIPTLLVFLLLSTMSAHADAHAATATEQIRDRLREEWLHFVVGEKRHRWRIEVGDRTDSTHWSCQRIQR